MRTRIQARYEKFKSLEEAEKQGKVADSLEVRIALLARVKAGEITLSHAQDELKKIKRNAKKNGMITRTQAYTRG
jgi:hypothetical protein